MLDFNELYNILQQTPGLTESIGMEKAMRFVRLAAKLKDEIITSQPPKHNAETIPEKIPNHVRTFLGGALGVPEDFVDGCWKAFGDVVWTHSDSDGDDDAETFRTHGLDHELCEYHSSLSFHHS